MLWPVHISIMTKTQCNRTVWEIKSTMCTRLMTITVYHPLSSVFFKFFLTNSLRHWKAPPLIVYAARAVLLSCSVQYRWWIIGNELSFIGFLPTQFEATVDGDAGSQFRKNSTHHQSTSSNEVLSEAALTFLEHLNLMESKISLIHVAMSYLPAIFYASGRTSC